MFTPKSTNPLEARKSVRLCARPNLRIVPQRCNAQTIYVAKDPITMRFFRLDEKQNFLLSLMDGAHTLADLRGEYEKRFRPDRLTEDELEHFIAELLEGGLIQSDAGSASERILDRACKHNRQWWLSLLNVAYIKIPLGNPDRWLTPLQPIAGILFGYTFLVTALTLVSSAILLLATHWREFLARLPIYEDYFRLETLGYLWLAFGVVKLLHELGHAVCCKRMGAQVQELGVVVIFFFPTLYCNVSDSWLLPSKWKRIAVSAAGIYVELLLAAAATWVWWLSDSGTILHHGAFAMMLYCSVNTILCNANPLMRFDGYHVLADWLEAPNLAQQCQRTTQNVFLSWLGISNREITPTGHVSRRFLFWYGISSLGYRWYVTAVALFFFHGFMKQHHVPVVGWIIGAISVTALIGLPSWQLVRWLHRQRRLREMKSPRVWLSFAGLAGLVAFLFFVPLPMKVRGVAVVQHAPEHVRRIVVPEVEGFLHEVYVRDGQLVKSGDVLAVLVNPKLEMKLRINEADQALRGQQQNAFIAQFADLDEVSDPALSGWLESDYEWKALTQEHRTLKEQRDRLILRATTDSIVMGLLPIEEKGKWLAKGTEFCRIGTRDALRALVLVDPADHRLIHQGSPTSVLIHGAPGRQWPGVVTLIAQIDAKNIPEALSNRVGGEVATRRDAATNTEKPHGQYYLVSVHLQGGDPLMQPGVLGRVKIDAESQTTWWRMRRWLGTSLNWGL